MNQQVTITKGYSNAMSPYIGRLAGRLISNFEQKGLDIDDDSWILLQEVLIFAGEAEKKVTNQEEKIKKLEALSSTDDLTGLANRRGMRRFLGKAIARARRHGGTGTIGYFDLDWFKDINDTLGHESGDKVLQHVANILKSNIRENDLAARQGGDEFLVILDHSSHENGVKRLKKIQDDLNNTTLKLRGMPVSIHTSMGITKFYANSKLDQVLAEADAEMYKEKSGKD